MPEGVEMGKDIEDFNFGFDIDDIFSEKDNGEKNTPEPKEKKCAQCPDYIDARCMRRSKPNLYRRAFSETKLFDILPKELEPGTSYHVISGGDIDSLSFLKYIMRQQSLEYLLFSTWCMADDDVLQIKEWVDSGRIKRIDAYVGEIFPKTYKKQFDILAPIIKSTGGRLCVFRNHAKIYAGIGEKFPFFIESSANINTNPRTENTCITLDKDGFDFYKEFFDGITAFNKKDFPEWVKHENF